MTDSPSGRARLVVTRTQDGVVYFLVGPDPHGYGYPIIAADLETLSIEWRGIIGDLSSYVAYIEEVAPEDFAEVVRLVGLPEFGSRAGGPDRPRPGGFLGRLLDAIQGELDERRAAYREVGRNLDAEYDPQELAAAMVRSAVPEPSPWDEVIGAFFSRSSAATRLGVSEKDLDNLVSDDALLEVVTSDGVPLYPAFQFAADHILDGFDQVLAVFDLTAITAWTLAGWFVSAHPALANMTPHEWMRSQRPIDILLIVARDDARRFSQ
jgi:hypothetical protein